MPLVNKVFARACEDPSVWPELRVLHCHFRTEARWRSFLRWLAARGSRLQSFVLPKSMVSGTLARQCQMPQSQAPLSPSSDKPQRISSS